MIYFQIKDDKNKIIAGNMQSFVKADNFNSSNKNFSNYKSGKGVRSVCERIDDIEIWIIVENEEDLLKSSKLFKKTIHIYKTVALGIYSQYKKEANGYAHILNTIQGQIRQKIDDFADCREFYGETYEESVKKILNIIENDRNSAADLICYIQKRILDMRAHLLGTEVVHLGEHYELKPVEVSLKRAILSQCTPFLEELERNMIKIKFFFEDECKIDIDKNMFSLIMYNFFSNAIKYAKFNSEIRFNYSNDKKSLDISMISLKMDKDEIVTLFNDGVRGRHAQSISGKGIGLFVIRRALELMGKSRMNISPNYEEVFNENGLIYNENHFKFLL